MSGGSNILSGMYNAHGHTLSFGGRKYLSTGVASFSFHFLPMSASLSKTPFGASSQWQAICNRGNKIRPGDFLILETWDQEPIIPPRQFRVDGVADYPHQFNYLAHMTLALSEHVQY